MGKTPGRVRLGAWARLDAKRPCHTEFQCAWEQFAKWFPVLDRQCEDLVDVAGPECFDRAPAVEKVGTLANKRDASPRINVAGVHHGHHVGQARGYHPAFVELEGRQDPASVGRFEADELSGCDPAPDSRG
jgi:hypothetical protein